MSEWRPIETAPKHNRALHGGTKNPRVIAWDGVEVFEARHFDGDWFRDGVVEGGYDPLPPIMWMPFPEPPDEGVAANAG